MPWVSEERCTGCGICVAECPVNAIVQKEDGVAEIIEAECIRCGECHEVCPEEAVRHDKERIPQEVAENLRWVRKLLGHFDGAEEQAAFMERMGRFFKKEKQVSERTLGALAAAGDKPAEGLEKAIGELAGEGEN